VSAGNRGGSASSVVLMDLFSEAGGAFAASAVVAIVKAEINGALFWENTSSIVGKLVVGQTPVKATDCGTLHGLMTMKTVMS